MEVFLLRENGFVKNNVLTSFRLPKVLVEKVVILQIRVIWYAKFVKDNSLHIKNIVM